MAHPAVTGPLGDLADEHRLGPSSVLGVWPGGTATKGEALVPMRWSFARIDRPS
jgi:hypothetical protein